MGIFRRVDVFIWIFKADQIHFFSMAINYNFRRIYVGCISVIIEALGLWSIFVIFLKELFSGWILFLNNGPLKGQGSIFP